MKLPEKTTILILIIAILVALNLGLVTFMWYTQRPNNGPEQPGTASFLIKELNFDKTQEQQYRQLQHELTDNLEPLKENDRHTHDRFFELMHAASPDSALVAATIDSMGHIRAQIEYLTFAHFRQVRAMCNAEQQKKFDQIISETMRRMGPRPPRRPNGPPPGRPDGPPERPGAPPDGPPDR